MLSIACSGQDPGEHPRRPSWDSWRAESASTIGLETARAGQGWPSARGAVQMQPLANGIDAPRVAARPAAATEHSPQSGAAKPRCACDPNGCERPSPCGVAPFPPAERAPPATGRSCVGGAGGSGRSRAEPRGRGLGARRALGRAHGAPALSSPGQSAVPAAGAVMSAQGPPPLAAPRGHPGRLLVPTRVSKNPSVPLVAAHSTGCSLPPRPGPHCPPSTRWLLSCALSHSAFPSLIFSTSDSTPPPALMLPFLLAHPPHAQKPS